MLVKLYFTQAGVFISARNDTNDLIGRGELADKEELILRAKRHKKAILMVSLVKGNEWAFEAGAITHWTSLPRMPDQ